MELIDILLTEGFDGRPAADLDAWWACYRKQLGANDNNALRAACVAAFEQVRMAWVVASGYAAALAVAFPTDGPVLTSLCVTEEGGNTPPAMRTRFRGGELTGTKTFATFGTDSERFVVLADASEHDDGKFRQLVLVEVDRAQPEVVVREADPAPFVPELPHGVVEFRGARGTELEHRDWPRAWARIKHFRLLEDICVSAATAAFLLRLARQTGQADVAIELLSVVAAFDALPLQQHRGYGLALAYEGARRQLDQLIEEFDWTAVSSGVRTSFERDRRLFAIGAASRHDRLRRGTRRYDLTRAREVERWTWQRRTGNGYEGYVALSDDDWLEWAEWELSAHGAGGGASQPVEEFLRKGGPDWAPDDIEELVREHVESCRG